MKNQVDEIKIEKEEIISNKNKESNNVDEVKNDKQISLTTSKTTINKKENLAIKKPSKKVIRKKTVAKTTQKLKEENAIKNEVKNVIVKEETVIENKPVKVTKAEIKEPIQKLTPEIIRVNAADFKNGVDGKDVQLIDVRTPREYKRGHIKNAVNVNIYNKDFITKTAKFDKNKPVYLYCRSGVRSMNAAQKLKNEGYKVYNLNGGILNWKSKGNKVIK